MYKKYEATNVVKMHQEPAQLRIVIDFDVPGHLAESDNTWALLETAKQAAELAIQNACNTRLLQLGIKYIGASVERD